MRNFPAIFDIGDEVVVLNHETEEVEGGIYYIEAIYFIGGSYFYQLDEFPSTVFNESGLAFYSDDLETYEDFLEDMESLFVGRLSKRGGFNEPLVYIEEIDEEEEEEADPIGVPIDSILDMYNNLNDLANFTNDKYYRRYANELMSKLKAGELITDLTPYLRFLNKKVTGN